MIGRIRPLMHGSIGRAGDDRHPWMPHEIGERKHTMTSTYETSTAHRSASAGRGPLARWVKRLTAVTAAVVAFGTGLSACGASSASKDTLTQTGGHTKVVVGVCPGPYGEMVEDVLAPLLKEHGYTLTTKLFNDYVQPNKALDSGSIQANLFQHINYLRKFSADNHLDIVSLGQVPTLGLGVYSNKYTKLSQIPDGATVSIASDASNLARSLGVLQRNGLITVKGDVDDTKATVNDIATNPKQLKLKTIDAAQLARSLANVDVSLVPGNFAWAAKLKSSAALAVERQSAGVINVVAVRKADAKTPFAKEVKRLLVSQEFKDKIAHSKFADFGKPTTW